MDTWYSQIAVKFQPNKICFSLQSYTGNLARITLHVSEIPIIQYIGVIVGSLEYCFRLDDEMDHLLHNTTHYNRGNETEYILQIDTMTVVDFSTSLYYPG